MNKEASEDLCVLGIIKLLGGIATTSKIKQKAKEFGYSKINVRKILRRLERQSILKKDRPLEDTLEIRWEFVSKEKRND